jgi:hypothetical protein
MAEKPSTQRRKSMDALPARPEFHDPLLRQALEQGAPAIEEFTTRLDKLSADIKNLEAFLERSAVRMTVRVRFPDPPGTRKRGGGRSWSDDEDESPYGEFLAWAKGEPDRFRIIYYRVVSGGEEGYPEEHDNCVLIEAPLELRVRARPMLPQLLLKVSEAAKLGDDDGHDAGDSAKIENDKAWGEDAPHGPPSDDDIPF